MLEIPNCKICKTEINASNRVRGHILPKFLTKFLLKEGKMLQGKLSKKTIYGAPGSGMPFSDKLWCRDCETHLFSIDSEFAPFFNGFSDLEKWESDQNNKEYYRMHCKVDYAMIDRFAASLILRQYLNGKIENLTQEHQDDMICCLKNKDYHSLYIKTCLIKNTYRAENDIGNGLFTDGFIHRKDLETFHIILPKSMDILIQFRALNSTNLKGDALIRVLRVNDCVIAASIELENLKNELRNLKWTSKNQRLITPERRNNQN